VSIIRRERMAMLTGLCLVVLGCTINALNITSTKDMLIWEGAMFWEDKQFFPWFSRQERLVEVLTLNTWRYQKPADVARWLNRRTIVGVGKVTALQELTETSFRDLMTRVSRSHPYGVHFRQSGCAIVSNLPILEARAFPFGGFAQIYLYVDHVALEALNFWSVHFPWHYYGPYKLCNTCKDPSIMNDRYPIACPPGMTISQCESVRVRALDQLMDQVEFAISSLNHRLMVIAGDFNEPSHLDWTEAARWRHCNQTRNWPLSETLANMGFTDAYRAQHPDPVRSPGFTWATETHWHACKFQNGPRFWRLGCHTETRYYWFDQEPQDRIDFIYFRRSLDVDLVIVDAKTRGYPQTMLTTQEQKSYLDYGNFPGGRFINSDHASVQTLLEVKPNAHLRENVSSLT